jgi:amino acid transporter
MWSAECDDSEEFPVGLDNEGGICAWTKREFGKGHVFLCGWRYWINVLAG